MKKYLFLSRRFIDTFGEQIARKDYLIYQTTHGCVQLHLGRSIEDLCAFWYFRIFRMLIQ